MASFIKKVLLPPLKKSFEPYSLLSDVTDWHSVHAHYVMQSSTKKFVNLVVPYFTSIDGSQVVYTGLAPYPDTKLNALS